MVDSIAEEQKSVSARIVETAIQRAEKEQEREERRDMNIEKIAAFKQDVQPLDAQFATIVIDPPWSYGNVSGRQRPAYAERMMDIEGGSAQQERTRTPGAPARQC